MRANERSRDRALASIHGKIVRRARHERRLAASRGPRAHGGVVVSPQHGPVVTHTKRSHYTHRRPHIAPPQPPNAVKRAPAANLYQPTQPPCAHAAPACILLPPQGQHTAKQEGEIKLAASQKTDMYNTVSAVISAALVVVMGMRYEEEM